MEKPERPDWAVPNRETTEFTALGQPLAAAESVKYGFGWLAVQYILR
jgi:hypothetical protein